MIARSAANESRDAQGGDRDAQLMVRAREGDTAAFDELTLRYRPYVLYHLTRLMGDDRFAEDLSQEVFLRAYAARGRYVARARFSTWLFIIVRNVAHNAQRWLSRHPSLPLTNVELTAADARLPSGAPSQEEHPPTILLQREERQFVQSAISQLCHRQQQAVYYRYYDGMSYSHVARQLGTSPQAVKSLLCRARETLRGSLSDYWDEGRLPAALPPDSAWS